MSTRVRPSRCYKHASKCDCLVQLLRSEGKTDAIDNLARHAIFCATMNSEYRIGIKCDWSHYSNHAVSEGHPWNFLLLLTLDEDFGETESDEPVVCKSMSCNTLSLGKSMMSALVRDWKAEWIPWETQNSLEMHVEELLTEGKPFATRSVRVEAGTWFRDEIIDNFFLLPRVSEY